MNFSSIFANLISAIDKKRTARRALASHPFGRAVIEAFSYASAFSSAWQSVFGRSPSASSLTSPTQHISAHEQEEAATTNLSPAEQQFFESEWEREDRINRISSQEEDRQRGPTDILDAFLNYREWLPVESSHVEALWYDRSQRIMQVEYHDGSVYEYANVSSDLAELFANASSKGTMIWDHFRRRGTQFGYNPAHPYVLIAKPQTRELKWFRTQASRLRHGRIGPSGE